MNNELKAIELLLRLYKQSDHLSIEDTMILLKPYLKDQVISNLGHIPSLKQDGGLLPWNKTNPYFYNTRSANGIIDNAAVTQKVEKYL